MRKLYLGTSVLIILFILAIYNVNYISTNVSGIISLIEEAERLSDTGELKKAEVSLKKAIEIWDDKSSYISIFLPHNAAGEAGFSLRQLKETVEDGQPEGFQSLIAQFESIIKQEQIRLGSIF